MMKDNNMKKSELAYVMAHLAQDLAAECASNEELTELNEDKKVTLARYKDDIEKFKDESATWQKRYYTKVNEYDELVIKVKAKFKEAGIDYSDLFPENKIDNYGAKTRVIRNAIYNEGENDLYILMKEFKRALVVAGYSFSTVNHIQFLDANEMKKAEAAGIVIGTMDD